MADNVSKNTNLHKFFKLQFNRETVDISIKNLLKQELGSILDLYRQNLNVQIGYKFVTGIVESKISLYPTNDWQLARANYVPSLPELDAYPVVYSCPLALYMAPKLRLSLKIVMEQLNDLLAERERHNSAEVKDLLLLVGTSTTGWINFFVSSTSIAIWLERSPIFTTVRSYSGKAIELELSRSDIFLVQYLHARCCSLLRLAERAKLVVLSSTQLGWAIARPQISWLDPQGNLWLNTLAEVRVLGQLLTVADTWEELDLGYWTKQATNLSYATATLLSVYSFLGDIAPPKAIARVGFIAQIQFWLQKILIEKLQVAAPAEL